MNILLTSAGRRSYLVKYFKDELKGIGKVHASNSKPSIALEAADYSVITPLIYEDNYIDFVIEYCLKHKINVVIPLFDIDLPILSNSKDRFVKEGIHLIVSDYDVTKVCNDKWKTYQFLTDNNFKTPTSFISLAEAIRAIEKNKISFPLIVKPRWGMGSISIFKVENRKELEVLYAKVKKEVQQTYLKYESSLIPDNNVIIQEFMRGEEYGLDIINDLNKRYIATLVKKKIEMRSGETDGAITIKCSVFEQLGKQLANRLGHIANLDTDCFLLNNQPYILEMNCRFGGGYPFSHLAGANLPKAIIKWIQGDRDFNILDGYRTGIKARKDINILEIKN